MDIHGYTSRTEQEHFGGRTLPGILGEIGSGIRQMVRSEIKLAKSEITEAARGARSSGVMFAIGGVLGMFALGFLFLTAMFALEIVLPNWLAALIVGLVLLLGAGIGIAVGRERLKAIHPPRETLQTIKEDFQWVKEHASL